MVAVLLKNKGSIYEILSILPKSLSAKRNVKGASLTLKINKQFIPFYLAIFIKDYTIKYIIKGCYKTNVKLINEERTYDRMFLIITSKMWR